MHLAQPHAPPIQVTPSASLRGIQSECLAAKLRVAVKSNGFADSQPRCRLIHKKLTESPLKQHRPPLWAWLSALVLTLLLAACGPAANIVAPESASSGVDVAFSVEVQPDSQTTSTTETAPKPEYTWDFGDGSTAVGSQATHAFTQPGQYKVTLKVKEGGTGQGSQAYETSVFITIYPAQASAAITAAQGGEVRTQAGSIVEIPAGVLSGDTVVQLTQLSPSKFALPKGFQPLGEALLIDTGGARLNGAISVSLPDVPTLPEGKVLAVFETTPPAPTGTSTSTTLMAMSTVSAEGHLLSVPYEALKGGKVNLSINQAGALMLGLVDAGALSGTPAPASTTAKSSQMPGDREKACSRDEDFRPLNPNESPSYETQLHSRHVACSEFGAEGQSTIVLDKDQNARYGYIDLKAKWSIHGPSNRLGKRMLLKLSYTYDKALSPPVDEVPVPPLKVRAVLSCIPTSNEHNPGSVNCNTTREFTLNDGAKDVGGEFDIPISWADTNKKIAEFRFILKLYYGADGKAPVNEGQVIKNDLEFVNLRCDIGQVWGQESGCVFPQASAVLVLDDNPQSMAHIRDAITANESLPGQYTGLRPGTRAIAQRSDSPDTGLQRLRVTSLIKANRAKSKMLCEALPSHPSSYSSCPDFFDPDSIEALTPCDCDEYPFASTREGAAMPRTYGEASVRYISRSDNRSAGAKLGAFLRKERLIDPFDHKRMRSRVPPPNDAGGLDPDKAWTINGTTLDATIERKNDPDSLYSFDFDDRYWIAY